MKWWWDIQTDQEEEEIQAIHNCVNVDDFEYLTIWTSFSQDGGKKVLTGEVQEAWDHQEEHSYQVCVLYWSTTTSHLRDTR